MKGAPRTPRPGHDRLDRRRARRRRFGLLLPLALTVLLSLLGDTRAGATPPAPTGPDTVASAATPDVPLQAEDAEDDGDDEIPRGCPGGPPGLPLPGTECPDGSTPRPDDIPRGCPGGAPGLPLPGTECPGGSVPRGTITEVAGCYGGPPGPPEPGTVCPDGTAPRDLRADEQLSDLLHMDGTLDHSLTSYDIGCDEGGATAFMRKMWCGFQALPFAMTKWLVGVGTNILDWALAFEVAEALTPLAGVLSRVYEVSFIGPLNLVHLAWVMTMAVVGLSILQGRTAFGLRELATTALVFIFGMMVMANPEGYLDGSRELAQNVSGAILQSTDDAFSGESGDPEEVRGRLSGLLQRSFVAEPYDLINWGEPLEGDCAAARDEILEHGPWGSDETPREMMRDAGCEAAADYNANPSDNRALASGLNAVATFLAMLFLLVTSLAVFVAQITLVLLFSVSSVVWIVALFPMGRSLLWTWLSHLVNAVLTTVAGVFLLAWMAIVGTTVLSNTTDMPIVQRSLIVVILAYVVYKARAAMGRVLDGARQRIAQIMQRGQSGAAPGPALSGRPGSFGVSPVAAASAAGMAGVHGAQRARKEAGRVPVAGRKALLASQATDQGLRRAAGTAAGAGKAVVMAPVLLPERIAQRRAAGEGATPRSQRVRERLDSARASGRQWRTNVAHPVRATRGARAQSEGRSNDTLDWM